MLGCGAKERKKESHDTCIKKIYFTMIPYSSVLEMLLNSVNLFCVTANITLLRLAQC
jgi:hypothetical protein